MSDKDERDLLAILKPECIQCVHLIGELSDESPDIEKSCRTERGCPAEHIQVVIGTDMNEKAEKLADAWRAEDPEKIEPIMKELRKMHPRIRQEIFQRAKGKQVIKPA